eukprot:TRINITY_DN8178_c0_g1_i1.p1 TRINITY_DN8178_c0_g1~~TRINITY_DN8178_c0_g1_i1.p1  ORF type:complete len:194 (+),score=38.58 TRINITY_DN8178_c0_g1_i1:219-800(+)
MNPASNTISAPPITQNTLDEPVHVTILRDLKRIGVKLSHVILPRGKGVAALKDWDLWGPLLLCLTLAIVLSQSAQGNQAALVFALVFVIVWLGAAVITLNAQLLGGTLSFFQSVCVLGYCIFPLTIAAIVLFIVGRVWNNILFKSLIVLVSFVWSTTSSVGFISGLVPAQRRALAVYPVLLFYLVIGWMILVE